MDVSSAEVGLKPELVEIDYTNWRGERRTRIIYPIHIVFHQNQWHPEPQWLLRAYDGGEGGPVKDFAMKDIHGWSPAVPLERK